MTAARLGHGVRSTAGLLLLATVPSGERWLVRDARVENALTVQGQTLSVFVEIPTVGSRFIAAGVVAAGLTLNVVDAFAVMEEGEQLYAAGSGGPFSALVSGHRWTL